MLGFGKKKNTEQNPNKAAKQTVEAANIGDDKFILMPQQYISQIKPAGPGLNRNIIMLVGGSVVILAILAVVLYLLFFSNDSGTDVSQSPVATQPVVESPAAAQPTDQTPPEEAAAQEKVISAESYDETNRLKGSLSMTIGADVFEIYGDGIGITVLSENDLSLPEGSVYVGGLYAVYPVGITFSEPISLEIISSAYPEGVSEQDVFPAVLRGSSWREIEDYELSLGGFSFTMDKFPSGPMALIYVPKTDEGQTPDFSVSPIVPSTDTDGDGLTDKEEILFGTSITSADTDGDSYPDWEEIQNGYSPTRVGETLPVGELFTTYTNSTYGYKVPYPTGWLADSLDQTNKQILFISDTEEFFEILIEENPLQTPIVDWFRGLSPSLKNIALDITVVDGRPAVWSPDKLTLYTGKGALVYIITYNKGALEEVNWPNVFENFYKNFSFGNTSQVEDGDLTQAGINCGTSSSRGYDPESGALAFLSDAAASEAAWQCFTENLSTCTAASINISDTGDKYAIIQPVGDKCQISILEPQTSDRTCGVPQEFISELYSELDNSAQSDTLGSYFNGYAAMSAILGYKDGDEISLPGGNTVTMECANN